MSKFTKGPWQVLPEEADKDYIRIRGTVWGGRYKVANVPTPVYEGVPQRELEETRANAALIAAAPELLAALEGLLADLRLRAQIEGDIDADGCAVLNCGNGILYAANKAVEKAKGGKA